MSSSPGEPSIDAAGAFAGAARAFAAGDFAAAARCLDAADAALAELMRRGGDPGEARAAHARLLAAVQAERERVRG